MSFSRTGPLTFLRAASGTRSACARSTRHGTTRRVKGDGPDDRASRVVHELDADLGDTTARAGAAENLDNLGKLDLSLGGCRLLQEVQVGRGSAGRPGARLSGLVVVVARGGRAPC